MNSKFKVGDKVTIRKDLHKGLEDVVDDMLQYAGREVIIKDVRPCEKYPSSASYSVGNGWSWYDYCFEEPDVTVTLTQAELNVLYLAIGDQSRMSLMKLVKENEAEYGKLRYGIGDFNGTVGGDAGYTVWKKLGALVKRTR